LCIKKNVGSRKRSHFSKCAIKKGKGQRGAKTATGGEGLGTNGIVDKTRRARPAAWWGVGGDPGDWGKGVKKIVSDGHFDLLKCRVFARTEKERRMLKFVWSQRVLKNDNEAKARDPKGRPKKKTWGNLGNAGKHVSKTEIPQATYRKRERKKMDSREKSRLHRQDLVGEKKNSKPVLNEGNGSRLWGINGNHNSRGGKGRKKVE